MKSIHHIIIGLLFALLPTALSAQVVVDAKLDSADILIGEQVHLTVNVVSDKGNNVSFPEYADGYITKGVEVLERTAIDTAFLNEGKRLHLMRRYTLTAFDSALYYLPPVEVLVNGKKFQSAGRLGLKVNTVPVDTTNLENIRPPHGVVEGEFQWTPRLLLIALILWAMLIGIYLLSARLSDKKPITRRITIKPPTPPHQLAMESIRKINTSAEEVGDKEYYILLTDILRTYIQERFHFNAKEMVSSEIIAKLQEIKDAAALRELKEVFETADLVKFAKHTTSLVENDRNMENVVEFVNTTKPEEVADAKPQVKEIIVGEVKQKRMRKILLAADMLLMVLAVLTASYLMYDIYETFL